MGKRIEKAKDKINAQDEESGSVAGCVAEYPFAFTVLFYISVSATVTGSYSEVSQ